MRVGKGCEQEPKKSNCMKAEDIGKAQSSKAQSTKIENTKGKSTKVPNVPNANHIVEAYQRMSADASIELQTELLMENIGTLCLYNCSAPTCEIIKNVF